MKKLLGFVLIIVALALGSYYGMGVLTERAIKKNIDVLNRANNLNVVLKSYHRGLFHSNAVLDWTLNPGSSDAAHPSLVINMPLVIGHGPIIFSQNKILFGLGQATGTVALPFNDPKMAIQFTAQSIKPVIHLAVFVSYFNQTTIKLVIPSFDLVGANQTFKVNSKGVNVDVHIAAAHKKIHGVMFLDNITWMKDQTQATLDQVKSDYVMHLSREGLSLGNANVSIPHFAVIQQGHKIFEIQDVNLHSENGVSKGLFNSTLQASINKLFLNQKSYTACELSVDINHLDAATLTDINTKLSKMSQADQTMQQNLLFSILADLPVLLNKGGELKVSKLHVMTSEGDVTANACVTFPKEAITNPFLLVQKIKGQGKIMFAEPLLKRYMLNAIMRQAQQHRTPVSDQLSAVQLPAENLLEDGYKQQVSEKINTLVQSGMLVLNGEKYIVELEFKNGALKVNGKAFNPSMLQL